MNDDILKSDVQQFIKDNLATDIHKILLSKSKFEGVTSKELVEQIESKIKSKTKLPTWFNSKNIYYPNKLNLSQTSSEITADYKASLFKGNMIVDVTAGFGVDSYAFSKKFKQVIHIEKSEELSKIANYNYKQLGVNNIECISTDGISYLEITTNTFDCLYIDPSRRDKDNKKVYYLSDCEPDVTAQLSSLLLKTVNILIKTGPLLDLKNGLRELKHVEEIHIVAINNDVKEVLWLIRKGFNEEPVIKTVNFKTNNIQKFKFRLCDEQKAKPTYSLPLAYIYEPNAAILKSGSFQFLSEFYNLNKIHPNSHLYTSDQLIEFPGRIFKVIKIHDYSKKSFKKESITHANVSVRNFPDSVSKVRKKLSIQDGGKNYLFCTTNIDENLIIISCFQIFKN
ncbi:THUMP-like domain-containing protein [Maribacter sp. Asnod1-A12]|uniref:THUMP-like domain-containing protein n=1 Tax=Maribacter sp. Asnod1-A12 TaxID=3160576 RepID=UPI0038683631